MGRASRHKRERRNRHSSQAEQFVCNLERSGMMATLELVCDFEPDHEHVIEVPTFDGLMATDLMLDALSKTVAGGIGGDDDVAAIERTRELLTEAMGYCSTGETLFEAMPRWWVDVNGPVDPELDAARAPWKLRRKELHG